MIAKLTGIIDYIQADYIILTVNNIGYQVMTPNPYSFTVGEEVTIFTHLYVRDDSLDLYGFATQNTKQLFLKLISVTGIGPKTALAILAGGDTSNVMDAINRGDVQYLRKFPKIGPKTAQQIILDLKGKLQPVEVSTYKELDEAILALQALGYKDKEIERVVKQLAETKLSTKEYITKALQLMLK